MGQALHAHLAPASAIALDEAGLRAFCARPLEAY
jgi:hypothetical protein